MKLLAFESLGICLVLSMDGTLVGISGLSPALSVSFHVPIFGMLVQVIQYRWFMSISVNLLLF